MLPTYGVKGLGAGGFENGRLALCLSFRGLSGPAATYICTRDILPGAGLTLYNLGEEPD